MTGPWEKFQNTKNNVEESTRQPSQDGPWSRFANPKKTDAPLNKNEETPNRSVQAGLEGFGEGVSLGYLNNLQALTEPLTFKALNFITGKDVKADDYVEARDSYNKRQESLAKENPKSFMAGQVAGTIASAIPAAGAGAAAGTGRAAMAARGLQAAKAGTIYGATQNTQETEGQLGGLDIPQRIENAGTGMATGILASYGGEALGAGARYGGQKLSQAKNAVGEKLKDLAETQAFKATGAMLKDFRNSDAKGEINEIGRYLLDKGILKVGDSVDDIAAKTLQYKKEAGQLLDKVYSDADSAIKNSIREKSFDPIRDKERILKAAKEELGDTVGATGAIEKLSNYIDDVAKNNIDDAMASADTLPINNPTMSPRRTNDIKGAVDEQINYARNPLSKEPASEKAFTGARRELNKIVSESIDELGGEQATKALKDANKQYGLASKTNRFSQDRVNREAANKSFGLTDTIAGSASAGYGIVTGDWETAIAAMAAKKGFEKYGTTGIAKLADSASKRLLQNPQMAKLAQVNPQAFKASVFSILDKIPKPSEAAPAIMQKAASNEAPQKGPDKWASVGSSKLIDSGIDQQTIEKLKQSKKGRDLLFRASDLNPNSKAMQNLMGEIQREGEM